MDVNLRAFQVVQPAVSKRTAPNKRIESSRKGGQLGGPARAKSISAQRRTEIAKKASRARWSKRGEKVTKLTV